MEIQINKREKAENREVDSLAIQLTEDIKIEITVNNFGELVLNKSNYSQGEGAIIIKPSVSNEIRIS